jgi:nucleotide-binding universal stress UspA family protein
LAIRIGSRIAQDSVDPNAAVALTGSPRCDGMGDPVVSIREVLFATDLSHESDHAFEHARLIAERFRAGLTLFHALDPSGRAADGAGKDDAPVQPGAEVRDRLERRAESLGVSHRTIVETSSAPQKALLDVIRSLQPDLTIMATHARSRLSLLLFGSVTEAVVNHAFRPVLCVGRRPHGGSALPYRRILVPTDLSIASRRAFPVAACFAQAFGAEVLGVHVVTPPYLGARPAVIPSEHTVWRFLQDDFECMDVTTRVLQGAVWERIVHAAGVGAVDLIVLSTKGRERLADRIVGSTAERVIRRAPCPVLVA